MELQHDIIVLCALVAGRAVVVCTPGSCPGVPRTLDPLHSPLPGMAIPPAPRGSRHPCQLVFGCDLAPEGAVSERRRSGPLPRPTLRARGRHQGAPAPSYAAPPHLLRCPFAYLLAHAARASPLLCVPSTVPSASLWVPVAAVCLLALFNLSIYLSI